MDKINVVDKLDQFNEHWSPKIIAELNESYIKLAKLEGEFIWHKHELEDEMFYVIEGQLTMKFRDRDVRINPNEFIVIPKGVEHMPVADTEVKVMLIESKSTLNTGNEINERTVKDLEWI